MKMISVSSSAITAAGYDESSQVMKITFSQGSTYDFCSVPKHIYDGLISASSVGIYYNSNIKGNYQCF